MENDDHLSAARKRELAAIILDAAQKGCGGREELRLLCRGHGMTDDEEQSAFDPWGGLLRALCESGTLGHTAQQKKAFRPCPPFAPHFEDVSADTPFADSILYLADCGITNGTDSHLFSPDAPITTHQWAVMLCRAYGLETSGTTWTELGQSAIRRVHQKRWMEATAISASDTQICRGALYKSAFAAAGVAVYDNTLYEGGEELPDYENCLRTGCELHLCDDDADPLEIVTRGEAAQVLHAILAQELVVKEPPAPVTMENRSGVSTNAFLLELRRVPQPILDAFNAHGWRYVIDYDYIASLSRRGGVSCTGATSYADKTIYISEAGATLHEFGHFLSSILNDSAVCERLYCEEAQNSCLRAYAKTNAAEYFADFFDYWVTNRQSTVKMTWLQASAPQTYTYFEALEADGWS